MGFVSELFNKERWWEKYPYSLKVHPDSVEDLWMMDNIVGEWLCDPAEFGLDAADVYYFVNKSDAVFFALKWVA